MGLTRRSFLKQTGLLSAGFLGLQRLIENPLFGAQSDAILTEGFGPLLPDPAKILDLPEGFTYRVISTAGESMDDGFLVPGLHDGMAAFPGPDGRTILVRNHELSPDQRNYSPYGAANEKFKDIDSSKLYDAGTRGAPALGGTTTLVFNTQTQALERHFLSLAGTSRNCAGGPTPWNSWITCEETVSTRGGGLAEDHGYNFEVPASDVIGLTKAMPLRALGRFNHEAVAVDPITSLVYETEDRPDGLFYRFLPNEPRNLIAGGRLQALRLKGEPRADTRNWAAAQIPLKEPLPVEWVNLEDIDSPNDDLRHQGFFAQGAARFARGEGIWHAGDAIYFACTNGGSKKKGQIWKYRPSRGEGTPAESEAPATLELFVEPNDGDIVENADNLGAAPWGDLLVCEDGGNPQFLLGITPEGRIYQFGRTTISELAGVTFSPDGTTMFVNIQVPGRTLAITGPWERRAT